MPKLEDFREMINGIDDEDLLRSGQSLLRDIMEIQRMKDRLADLEQGLTEGGKAVFYFFAEELDEDEIVFAAERISGRLKRLERSNSSKSDEKNTKENTNINDENDS